MSNEDNKKQPEPDRHAKWLKGPNGMEAIAVGDAQFGRVLDVPGMGPRDRIKSSDQLNVRRVKLWFLPWMRALMISTYEPSGAQPEGPPIFVGEAMVAWRPQ